MSTLPKEPFAYGVSTTSLAATGLQTIARGYFRVDRVVFTLQWARWSIDALRIVPIGGVTLRMFLEMLKSIENAGHSILGASGFNDHSGRPDRAGKVSQPSWLLGFLQPS